MKNSEATGVRTVCMVFILSFGITVFGQTATDYFNESIILEEKGKYELSLDAINKSIQLDSLEEDFYFQKGVVLFSLNRYEEAKKLYTDAIGLFPRSPGLHLAKGNLLSRIGEAEFAITHLENALEFTESDSLKFYIRNNIAINKRLLRNFEDAHNEFKELYLIDSANIHVLIGLGNTAEDLGLNEEALDYYKKAMKVSPNNVGPYINIGFLLQKEKSFNESIDYFDRSIELNSSNPFGYSNRSFSYLELGELEKAMEDINYSIKLFPANSYAYKIRGLIHLKLRLTDNACNDFEEALRKGYTEYYGDEALSLKSKHCK